MPSPVVQVAYAADDLEGAARAWSERTGASPFFVRQHPPAEATDAQGRAALFCHASAYGQWGALQLELVKVQAQTSASLRDVVPAAPGLHHVTWFAADLAAEQRRLTALGWPVVMMARTSSGLAYAFHDACHDLGHLFEVYDPTRACARSSPTSPARARTGTAATRSGRCPTCACPTEQDQPSCSPRRARCRA